MTGSSTVSEVCDLCMVALYVFYVRKKKKDYILTSPSMIAIALQWCCIPTAGGTAKFYKLASEGFLRIS